MNRFSNFLLALFWGTLLFAACKKEPVPLPDPLGCIIIYTDTVHYIDTQYIDTFVMKDAIYLTDNDDTVLIDSVLMGPIFPVSSMYTLILFDSATFKVIGGYRDTSNHSPEPIPPIIAESAPCYACGEDGYVYLTYYMKDTTIFLQREIPHSYVIFEVTSPDGVVVIDTAYYYRNEELYWLQYADCNNIEDYLFDISNELYNSQYAYPEAFDSLWHKMPWNFVGKDSVYLSMYFIDTYPYYKQITEADVIYYFDIRNNQ